MKPQDSHPTTQETRLDFPIASKQSTIDRSIGEYFSNNGFFLNSVTNALVSHPYPDKPLPPEGCALVADMPHRIISDSDIFIRYLEKRGPLLANPIKMEYLASQPRLSFIGSYNDELFKKYGPFEDWPHAKGSLAFNPLYMVKRRDDKGDLYLQRRLSPHFYGVAQEEDNNYLPEQVHLDPQALRDLIRQRCTLALEALIKRCVVFGMPKRYSCS